MSLTDRALACAYTIAIIVVVLDTFVWRAS